MHEIMLRQFGHFDLNAFVSVEDDFGMFHTIVVVWLSRVFINVADVFAPASNCIGGRGGHNQRRPLSGRLIGSLDVCRVDAGRKSEAVTWNKKKHFKIGKKY